MLVYRLGDVGLPTEPAISAVLPRVSAFLWHFVPIVRLPLHLLPCWVAGIAATVFGRRYACLPCATLQHTYLRDTLLPVLYACFCLLCICFVLIDVDNLLNISQQTCPKITTVHLTQNRIYLVFVHCHVHLLLPALLCCILLLPYITHLPHACPRIVGW